MVAGALSDDLRDRFEHLQRELRALRDQCGVMLAAHRAVAGSADG